jgi:ankyrin repeat protein
MKFRIATGLHGAAYAGQIDLVEQLLNQGAEVNARWGQEGKTPLHLAAESPKEERIRVAKLLLERGADINAMDEAGWTPLTTAVLTPHLDMVKLLIERGANVNAKAKQGWTALHSAVGYSEAHIEAVRLLLNAGAKINQKSIDGWTPLTRARRDGRTEILTILKTHERRPWWRPW